MGNIFWERMHGGATHFPIALVVVSVVFDHAGFWWRNEIRGREFRAVAFYSLIIAAAASFLAVFSGLALSKGRILGTGAMAMHHWFVWPAFGFLVGLAVWRLVLRERTTRRAFGYYLVPATIAVGVCLAAGYWGGEMVLGNS